MRPIAIILFFNGLFNGTLAFNGFRQYRRFGEGYRYAEGASSNTSIIRFRYWISGYAAMCVVVAVVLLLVYFVR